jgi:uncharacterized C2H2 Zn-finger protein
MLTSSQKHQRDQDIVCPGCDGKFTRAGNYVEHLENGRCEKSDPSMGITRREFKESIQQKHIVKEILKNPDAFTAGFRDQIAPALPSDLMSENDPGELEQIEDGGVNLMDQVYDDQTLAHLPLEAIASTIDQNDQIEEWLQCRVAAETWPRLPGLPEPSINSAMGNMSLYSSVPSIAASKKSASQFASDITSRRGGHKVQTVTDPTSQTTSPSDIDFSETASGVTIKTADFQMPIPWTTGNASQAMFKDGKLTPVPGDFDSLKSQDERSLWQSRFWDRYSSDYKVPWCYNPLTGRYECPIAGCGAEYKDVEDLEGHLINAHVKTKNRCPLCLKIFNSVHAFISHAERSGRCKVKDTSYFDKFLNEVTGGFLEAEQVHQPKVYRTRIITGNDDEVVDGAMSIRFEAALPHDY